MESYNIKCPCPTLGYLLEELDGEIVLFHPGNRTIFYSNHTGALIWQLCDGQRNIADIVQILSTAYPNAVQQIQTDVQDTLSAFAKYGAITWS